MRTQIRYWRWKTVSQIALNLSTKSIIRTNLGGNIPRRYTGSQKEESRGQKEEPTEIEADRQRTIVRVKATDIQVILILQDLGLTLGIKEEVEEATEGIIIITTTIIDLARALIIETIGEEKKNENLKIKTLHKLKEKVPMASRLRRKVEEIGFPQGPHRPHRILLM